MTDSPLFALFFILSVLLGLGWLTSGIDEQPVNVSLCETKKGALFMCTNAEDCETLKSVLTCESFKTRTLTRAETRRLERVIKGRRR